MSDVGLICYNVVVANGAGELHITIGDGTLRVIMRNDLVTYVEEKWFPPENWSIDTARGG